MSLNRKKFDLSPRLKLGVGRAYSQNQILKISAVFCLILAGLLAINAGKLFWQSSAHDTANNSGPQVLGASDTKVASPPTVQFIEYSVQKGDTLFSVSQTYNISWATLATLNNLKSPFTLKPGQTLKIPKQ